MTIGARIMLLVCALLLVLTGYLYWSPLGRPVANGFPARCGSAAHPPSNALGKAICGTMNDTRRAQTLSVLIAAVIIGVGGVTAFGVRSRPADREPSTA